VSEKELFGEIVDDGDDPIEISFRHGGPGGEAQSAREEILRDLPADCAGSILLLPLGQGDLAAAENRLQMHGFPHRAGFDVFRLKRKPHLLTIGAEDLRRDEDYGQPAVGRPVIGLRHEFEAGKVTEGTLVIIEDLSPTRHPLIEDLELCAADGSQDVAHAVVEADLGMLVVRLRTACLLG